MLDDLGGPAFKGPDPGLKFLRLPADLDLPETLTFPGAAKRLNLTGDGADTAGPGK